MTSSKASSRYSQIVSQITHDINTAMRDAFKMTAHLHRDISISNVILVRESGRTMRRGYLIDWDSCCPADESGEAAETGRAVGSFLVRYPRAVFDCLLAGNVVIHVTPNVEHDWAHGQADVAR